MIYGLIVEYKIRPSFDHINTLKSGKIHALDVFEVSREVARALDIQTAQGPPKEPIADQIVS